MKHHYALFIVFLFIIPKYNFAQQKATYNIEFVKAKWLGPPSNDILVVFQVTPIDMKDWLPIFSEKITYSIDNGKDTTLRILNKASNISAELSDTNVKYRNNQTYEMVKDNLFHFSGIDILFITFNFHDRVAIKPKKMSVTYGMWEKNNQNVRVEKKYDFNVE